MGIDIDVDVDTGLDEANSYSSSVAVILLA